MRNLEEYFNQNLLLISRCCISPFVKHFRFRETVSRRLQKQLNDRTRSKIQNFTQNNFHALLPWNVVAKKDGQALTEKGT
jgi:hypothetical protein